MTPTISRRDMLSMTASTMASTMAWLAVGGLGLSTMACTASPRPLVPGEDSCAFCRMTIDDARFGALVVTAKGRLEPFDSIECAAAYVQGLANNEPPRTVWVADFSAPARWVDATRAVYLHGSRLRSPMGRELVAFAADADTTTLLAEHGGTLTTWSGVRALVSDPVAGFRPTAGPSPQRDTAADTTARANAHAH
jgi:copper chaperone NosL